LTLILRPITSLCLMYMSSSSFTSSAFSNIFVFLVLIFFRISVFNFLPYFWISVSQFSVLYYFSILVFLCLKNSVFRYICFRSVFHHISVPWKRFNLPVIQYPSLLSWCDLQREQFSGFLTSHV
jgi:hypothetical protein